MQAARAVDLALVYRWLSNGRPPEQPAFNLPGNRYLEVRCACCGWGVEGTLRLLWLAQACWSETGRTRLHCVLVWKHALQHTCSVQSAGWLGVLPEHLT